jgi:hypothetical protein
MARHRMVAARTAMCLTCRLRDATCALWQLPDDRRRTILSDPRASCPVSAWRAETTSDDQSDH